MRETLRRAAWACLCDVSALQQAGVTLALRLLDRRLLDQLDPIPIRIPYEAQPRAPLAHRVRRLLRLDPLLAEARERSVKVVGGDRDVPVRGAELVVLDAEAACRRRRAGS
jgi:hypothetical protein